MENTEVLVYANRVEVSSSMYDVFISLFQSTPEKDDVGNIIGEDKGVKTNIIMSPQHAKVFVDIMTKQLAQYEQEYGPIAIKSKDEEKTGQ